MKTLFNKTQITNIVHHLSLQALLNIDYLYKIYLDVNESLDILKNENTQFEVKNINQYDLLFYCIGEYHYSVSYLSEKQRDNFIHNDKVFEAMTSVICDKYLSLSLFNHQEEILSNRYLPPASSIYIYINLMLNIVKGYKKNDPQSSLISDLLMKSLTISRSILDQLLSGYETEAFSSWRTLHECECTLILLDRYGEPLINRYIKHMRYGLAFNNAIADKEEQDKVFYEMKDEMRQYNLKSKDIKRYIEYGWLYILIKEEDKSSFKLNFRDGLESLANLKQYAKRYEISSEIIHSTPLLIYSNKQYFYYMTLLSLYESFFRLEKVFMSLFSKRVGAEQMQQYQQMRRVYYSQLIAIHKRELQAFKNLQQKQNKN